MTDNENSAVEDQLRQVVADALGVDTSEIRDDSSAKTIPSWNSYNHLTVMTAVEEMFNIMFSMEEMTGIANFGELKTVVFKHEPSGI